MRIGIISLCHKNYNYGGMLQAYALPKAFEKIGVSSRQICYEGIKSPWNTQKHKSYLQKFMEMNMRQKRQILIIKFKESQTRKVRQEYRFSKRRERFDEFLKENIYHDDTVYINSNIDTLKDKYDAFVVGSDQVWNNFISNMYMTLVGFAPENKKFSYAASIAKPELDNRDRKLFGEHIGEFEKISVRESSAVNLLKEVTDKAVEVVADPVLLPGKNEWDKIAVLPKLKHKYVFGYFLGNDMAANKTLRRIMKKTELPLEMIPYTRFIYNFTDKKYADINLTESGPREFIGLIKKSEYVVTDSFHAMVFAVIYHKNFIVLDREKSVKERSMNSRIKDFLETIGLESRLVDTVKESDILYDKIDWKQVDKKLNEIIDKSYAYLREIKENILGKERA